MALQDIISRFDMTKPRTTLEAVALNEATANPMPDEYESLRKQFTPEEIEILKNPDPNKPVLEQLYRKTVQMPKVISEKGMKAARTASHIGNSLSVLADMFGASQGAHIQRRSSGLVENQVANERAIRGQNEAETNQYNSGLLHAQYNDQQQAAQEKAQRRANMLSLIKMQKAEEQQARRESYQAQKDLISLGYKGKELEMRMNAYKESKRHNVAMEKKATSKSEKEKKFTGVVINARPDDPQAQQDASGNKVIKYDMTPEEVNNVSNKAKRDAEFLQRHPELYVTSKNEYTGEVKRGLTKDEEVAWAYLQEQYDNGKPAPEQPQQKKIKIPQLVPTKKIPGF